MEAMASSLPNKKLYDPIRKKWVEAFPEEIVRQKILALLIDLGYSPHFIVVEKNLSDLPLVKVGALPNRRIDILCLEKETLSPLILIECKGVPIHEKMLPQLLGYNAYIGALLVCLASSQELILDWREGITPLKKGEFPSYEEMKTYASHS